MFAVPVRSISLGQLLVEPLDIDYPAMARLSAMALAYPIPILD